MATYPMNPVDAAWYHMDGPANLAIVTGVLQTRQALNFDQVRQVYQERLTGFARFYQRVVETGFPLATPHWQDMPHFDINQHMHHIALAAPHDQAALRALVSDIASTPLDHAQPLWQVFVVDDVQGGSALIMRCHHCMADGTALMTISLKLFDKTPLDTQLPGAAACPVAATPLSTTERASRDALALVDTVLHAATHSLQTIEKAAVLVSGAGMLVGELLKKTIPNRP